MQNSSANPPRPLKLAFISPYNLFDVSSGAAQSLRTMLEQLARRGAACVVLSGCCFDVPPGERLPELLRGKGLAANGRIDAFNLPVWQGRVNGVAYNVVQLRGQMREQMPAIEEMAFRDLARTWLAENRPDAVFTYGGLLLDIEIQRCIRAAGAKVVFYLPNPSYGRPETFANVDLILANSSATVEHYARTMQLSCRHAGIFVDTQGAVASGAAASGAAASGAAASGAAAPVRAPQYVSFINPLPAKGVALFLKLVQKAAQEAPDMRFLVVESRGAIAPALQALGYSSSLLEKMIVLPQQQNMAAVYVQTRILLVPSFWFEAAGRVLVEANANGIPVLATDRGGIPETLGDAGRLLPIPQRCTVDFMSPISDDEVQPWWDELHKLWRDPDYYAAMSRRAYTAAAGQTLERKAENLEMLLRAAIDKVQPAGG